MKGVKMFLAILFSSLLIGAAPAFAVNLNLLDNPGFERKSIDTWSAFDSCRFVLSDQAWHSGKRALAFFPLKEGAGIAADVSLILQPGYKFSFNGWFRNLEAGWGQVDVILMYQQTGTIRQIIIGRADCNKEAWTEMSNEFFIPDKADHSGLQLVVKTAWGQIAFLVDDLELRPALQIQFVRTSPLSEPDLLFQLGVQSEERTKLKASITIFDDKNQMLKPFTQSLYTPIRNLLPAGFYRIVATVSDLDKRQFADDRICYFGMLDSLNSDLENQVKAILLSRDLDRYHGWVNYLQYRFSSYQQQSGETADNTLQAIFRLNKWVQAIRTNPNILDTLSGVQEWAYLSRVDDSGQPFKIAIPSGYDPKKIYPLVVVMHGYGGNHLEYSGGVRSNPEYFELHVLGRARGGGYVDLSEADVLAAVDYVRDNWRIDNRRIHLTGASMGGGGTFRLLSRYPDRWASGRPVCGYGSDLPILNGLHVPVYSTHSQDDPSVPVLGSRAPLQRLMKAGGQVVIDETNGLQHAAWNYTEGNNRALQWMHDQVRPENRNIYQVEYTAIDRQACGAYWLKVAEWGSSPGPAYFKATAGTDNQLYLNLENIRMLQVRISDSPFNSKQDLNISINGNVFFKVTAPLTDSIIVAYENGSWSAITKIINFPEYVLHTPGGVHNLYHNEPLLIVYGTAGDQTVRQAMLQAAISASKSVNPMWVGDQGDLKEGVPNHQLLYGHLKMKPDTAVTESDYEKYNLLLIGKADENRIIEKIQKQLPVQFAKEIICSDGFRLPGNNNMLGLYFYNPLAPGKLIYWVAADNPTDYRPYNILLQLQNSGSCGTDLLIVRDNPPLIIKVRCFDSRWNWCDVFKNSARLAADENTFGEVFRRTAEAVRIATGSDFTLQQIQAPPELQAGMPGVTQWSDIATLDLTTPIAVLQMKGALLLSHQQGFSERGLGLRFYPTVEQTIKPDHTYQVALPASYFEIQQLINIQQHVPDSFEITDITLFEVMKRMLF